MKSRKGFTIVELVIVIAVIAILAGVLIPTFSGIVTKAQESAAMQTARNAYIAYLANSDVAKAQTKDDDYIIVVGDYLFTVIDCQFYETAYTVADDAENGGDAYSVVPGENDVTTITVDNEDSYFASDKFVSSSTSEYFGYENKTPDNITKYTLYKLSNTPTEACFSAGTQITMADGSLKNIEDVTEGDLVLTFNHETGRYEGQKVYLAWHGEYKAKGFTLHFDNGNTVTIVGEHDLFEKESLNYVTITEATAEQFIGKHFYSVADERYVELTGVTYETEEVDFYSLSIEYNANSIANGMLSVPVETEDTLRIYKFNEDLTIDLAQLEADIATYGIFEYPSDAEFTKEFYDAFKMKYINIMVGKGLVTRDTLLERIADGLDTEN